MSEHKKSGYSCNSHSCRRQDLLFEKKQKPKPNLWTKASLHMKLGFWASQNFWRSTYVSRPQFLLPLSCSGESTSVWHNAKYLSVFSCPRRLHMMSEPWWAINWRTSEPGWLFFCTSVGKAEHLAKSSPSLSPCRVISQWASNYSGWHAVRSCVRYIYLIFKLKILQWIIQKEIITFVVHFPNLRLCL